jgi:hypothetical protein
MLLRLGDQHKVDELTFIDFFLCEQSFATGFDYDDELYVGNYLIPELGVTSYRVGKGKAQNSLFQYNSAPHNPSIYDDFFDQLASRYTRRFASSNLAAPDNPGLKKTNGAQIDEVFFSDFVSYALSGHQKTASAFAEQSALKTNLVLFDGTEDIPDKYKNCFGVRIRTMEVEGLTIEIGETIFTEIFGIQKSDGSEYESSLDYMIWNEDRVEIVTLVIGRPMTAW